jgi:hypothetical protein
MSWPSVFKPRATDGNFLVNQPQPFTFAFMKIKKQWSKPTLQAVLISLECTAYSATA